MVERPSTTLSDSSKSIECGQHGHRKFDLFNSLMCDGVEARRDLLLCNGNNSSAVVSVTATAVWLSTGEVNQ